MSEVSNAVSDTASNHQPSPGPDHGSATSAMIVGSVFVALVGAAVLVSDLYRRYPILIVVFTLAAIVAAVLLIT